MDVVDEWTGRHASALRRALRLTNESFAARLGTAVRTVARWSTTPELVPLPELQMALDTELSRADESARARFAALLRSDLVPDAATPALSGPTSPTDALERELSTDTNYGAAFEWLDGRAGWREGEARRRVAQSLSQIDQRALQDRGHRRARVNRADIANALAVYYATLPDGHHRYSASVAGRTLSTSLLTRPSWLDLGIPLASEAENFTVASSNGARQALDPTTAQAAVQRLAEARVTDTRLVNAPIYLLQDIDIRPGRLSGTMSMARFVDYALTLDLLESELVDALATNQPTVAGTLPLRDRYLPDATAVLDVSHRPCAGGPLALLAIARPAVRPGGQPDYLFLIQERGGRVLNAARRLAPIPKCFHGPLVDYAEDARPSASLERELEEELFGRLDVDSALDGHRHADPMHNARLSAPMRWLVERRAAWTMDCTGFGLNLVSGNFEFASLIVIEDEEWWGRFGGDVVANWESDGLRRYSSLDRELLVGLLHDPAWSNEGLFALLQAFRHLTVTADENRIDLPTIDWERT